MAELKTAWKGVSKYFVCSVMTCYAICLHFGFYGWILYSPEVLVYFFFNVSEISELPDQSTQLFFLELAIDLFPLGALIGTLLSGYLGDRFGRKGTLVVTNFLSILSILFLACDMWVYVYEFTICAHLLTGICLGINFCIMYLYLFEMAPRPIRGGIIMLTDFFVKLGNLIAQILTYPSIIGHQKGWYLLVFLAAIIPLTLIYLLTRIPESPRYLLIQKGDEETATNVLQRLKVSGNVEEEMEELRQEQIEEKEEKTTDIIHFGKISSVSWTLFSITVIMIGTQLAGFQELYYHNYEVLRNTEMGYKSMWLLKIVISVLLCFIALLGTYLVDYVGRRILFLSGLAICTVSLILMVVVLELMRFMPYKKVLLSFNQTSPLDFEAMIFFFCLDFICFQSFPGGLNETCNVLYYLCIGLLVTFIAAYSIGPNIISVIISLELFLQSSRATALAIAASVYCLINICLTLTQGKLKKELGSYSLLIFSPFCVIIFIYYYVFIPETKNQTFTDIRKMTAIQKSRKIHVKKDQARKEPNFTF